MQLIINYEEAIEILHKRYKNKQVLVSTHMQKLDKLPRIKFCTVINKLRKTYDQFRVCVRNLKALNIDIITYGAILVPFLTGKLHSETIVVLSRNFQNDIWQLDGLLKILKEKRDRNYTTSAFLNTSLERKCPFYNLSNHPA